MDISQVNLMENIKMSKSRDFRINVQIVQESLQVSSDDDEEQDEENDNQEQNDAGEASPEDEQVSWKLTDFESCQTGLVEFQTGINSCTQVSETVT